MNTINLAKLGERINSARGKKKYTQQKIAFILNLGDTKTISKWENGKQRPEPENLHALAKALEVSYAEEIYWMGLAGYIPPARLPNANQLLVLERYYPQIADHPYPAYFLDHRLNYWAINQATVGIIGSIEYAGNLVKQFTNVFDIIFNPEYKFTPKIEDLHLVRKEQVRRFISRNLHHRHEQFYCRYPQYFSERLRNAQQEYQELMQYWRELEPNGEEESVLPEISSAMMGYIILKLDGMAIEFQLVAEPNDYFYGNIFEMVRYYPKTERDKELADEYFSQFSDIPCERLKLWKVRDLNEIISHYNKLND